MTVTLFESLPNLQSLNGSTWTSVASKSGTLGVGEYWVWLFANYGGSLTNKDVRIRATVNGVDKGSDYHNPSDSSLFRAFSVFGQITVTVEGLYTIGLEVMSESASQNIKVKNIRLMVMKQ